MMRAVPIAEDLIDEAEVALEASKRIDHPHRGKDRADAEDLLSHALSSDFDLDDDVDAAAAQRFRRLVARRVAGEPVAYITGRVEFNGLDLIISKGAFIPRESSEFMADQAIRRLRRRTRPVYVDMATGIGPVALSVASSVRTARVYGVDLSARPIALARKNARALGLRNARFLCGDLFRPLPRSLARTVDVITVHPPYVGSRELRELPDEIRLFEPRESLTDFSPMGMSLIQRMADEAPDWLRSGGWLLVEVSPDHARGVATTLRRAGFRDVRSTKGGIEVSRVVVGRRAGADSPG
jgi:release factor glutamine methyltransferase